MGFVLLKFSTSSSRSRVRAIFGWKFAVGFVVLDPLARDGALHRGEARRPPSALPVFIPFLGAYVQYTRGHPWQTVRVASPARSSRSGVGGLLRDRAAERLAADVRARLLRVLLNLFNLLPFGIFDGGAVWRSARWPPARGGRGLATASYALYFGTAAMLIPRDDRDVTSRNIALTDDTKILDKARRRSTSPSRRSRPSSGPASRRSR